MTDPSFEHHCDRFKSFLGTAPENGWVFGACAAIARRTGWELWAVRLVAAICLLSFTLLTVLAYFIIAMLLDETRPAAQRKISRWARSADTLVERVWSGLREAFTSPHRHHET